MRRDYQKNRLFNRRSVILGGIRSFLSALLVTRLSYLQIIKHKEYSTKSDRNRIRKIVQPAPRGVIYDRNKKSLVYNVKSYRLLLYLEDKRNVKQTIEQLAKILEFDEVAKEKLFTKLTHSRSKSVVALIDNLSWEDLSKIEVNSYRLPELSIESAPSRFYPFALQTAHLLGYVSMPNDKEISNNRQEQTLFMHPNFRVGKSGVEKSFDKYLRGQYGVKYSEVNAFGLPIRDISKVASKTGPDLMLTIDIELQRFIYEKVANLSASVVVLDVKTGEILALNSTPTFDPNVFSEGISQEYWQELRSNEGKPLNNKPLSAYYPPGSVFKLMVALAALENGFDRKTTYRCSGHQKFGRRTFHCWEEKGHGVLDLQGAIKHSCNIYFFNTAQSIGIDKITAMARKFGYEQAFTADLQEIKPHKLPSDEWKRKVYHQPWVGGDTLNSAIGQGFVLASPIQIAVATARICNGGIPIVPYLVKNGESYNQYKKLKDKPIVNPEFLEYVKGGMYRVMNEGGGTAFGSRITDKDFEIAGKTGTAQVISKREKEMSAVEMKLRQNHAIFTGFGPFNDPRYCVTVFVEHGGAGSRTAAPIGKAIFEQIRQLEKGVAANNIEGLTNPEAFPPQPVAPMPPIEPAKIEVSPSAAPQTEVDKIAD